MKLDNLDSQLLALLKADSRTSTSLLARSLGVSRTTVRDRMQKLKRDQVIAGFTISLHKEFLQRQITAQVMIQLDPKAANSVNKALLAMNSVRMVQAVSGPYDLFATVASNSTEQIDAALDQIGNLEGVVKTLSSIVLSTKFER